MARHTHEISFPSEIKIQGNKIRSIGNLIFDRTLFNVRYGLDNFLENLGDKLIYDDIEIEVNLIAKRQQ